MDTNMEDVSRPPADISPAQSEPATIPTLDGWIESLMSCKQLAESDVQRLCDKVSRINLYPCPYGAGLGMADFNVPRSCIVGHLA